MPETNDILVTIIIPVFNKAGTLRRCIKSIQNQTYKNLEILLVDDCSTDHSPALAARLQAEDNRIRLVQNQNNVGCYRSRLVGINNATGQLTMFADADDTMEPRAVELAVELLTSTDVDLVQFRSRRRMKWFKVRYMEQWDPSLAGHRIDGIDFRSLASFVGMDSYIYPSAWGKLYRTDILRSIKFIDFAKFWGEDQILNIQYLRAARSMAFLDYVGYLYYWGGETASKYKFSILQQYKYVHSLKRIMGQSEEYIDAEIQVLLRYHVRQLITELGWTPEAVEQILTDELRDPLWKQVGFTLTAHELIDSEMQNIHNTPIKYIAKKLLK